MGVFRSDFQKPQTSATAGRHCQPSQAAATLLPDPRGSGLPGLLAGLGSAQTLGLRQKGGVSQRSPGKSSLLHGALARL